MAIKNALSMNKRLDVGFNSQVAVYHKQHISKMARHDYHRLDTILFLKEIKQCPSDKDPLSIKFLGPVKSSYGSRKRSSYGASQSARDSKGNHGDNESSELPPITASPRVNYGVPQTARANFFAPAKSERELPEPRSNTFANDEETEKVLPTVSRKPKPLYRKKSPFTHRVSRFYDYLTQTKSLCGLKVTDSSQTELCRIKSYRLSHVEWKNWIARLQPEFFAAEDAEADCEDDEDQHN